MPRIVRGMLLAAAVFLSGCQSSGPAEVPWVPTSKTSNWKSSPSGYT
jgi:hypothetical protein